MKRIKDLDLKIVYELMKNAKTSDRQLAKTLGVSQPTVTRRRAKIEKEIVNGYTAIPKWEKLGYKILAIILVHGKSILPKEKYLEVMKRARASLMTAPNIIMGGPGEGMGMNGFLVSLHKNYADYDSFVRQLRREGGEWIDDVRSFIVNLTARERLKPLHLKYLAETE